MKYLYLTKNDATEVDDDTYLWASKYNWLTNGSGYVLREGTVEDAERKGKSIYLHIEIMTKHNKYTSATEVYDHVDRDKLNNQLSNLRICTRQQNCCNSGSRKGSSKYKGVTRHHNKWQARIRVFNKCISLGHFKIEEEAAKAYNKAAKLHFGEFAYLNVLETN
jgi:hypothetical protein